MNDSFLQDEYKLVSKRSVAAIAVVCLTMLPGLLRADTVSTGTVHQDGAVTTTMVNHWISSSEAAWVWPAGSGKAPNQYVQMIHKLELPSGSDQRVELAISADTNYAVWLNGKFAGFGQWSDYPDDKTFDQIDLKALARPGANRLCILGWYQGESTSQYLKGAAGLVYAVRAGDEIVAASGPETRMRQAPNYVSGPVPRVSPQLSFTFEHRGDKDDGWLTEDYGVGPDWKTPGSDEVKPLDSRPVRPRPVAKLILGERLPMRILSQGVFHRTGELPNPAVAVQTDALSFRPADALFSNPRAALTDSDTTGLELKAEAWKNSAGAYLVLDAGRQDAGLLELELDAPEGTVVDVGYGEHLEDLRVRAHIGGRQFANRHVCGKERSTFLHPFLRLAGRYIQVHITPPAAATDDGKPVILHYAGLRPTEYPVTETGMFKSPDSIHNRIWEVSARTLHLCMHEHYEDSPWREQALYAMDGRNQALAGYYCFGNYDFAKASLGLLGYGQNEDGFLELCAPAKVHITIPCFSHAWIHSLEDYLMFSGDREFVRSQLPIVRRILEGAEGESTGPVILTPQGPRMWNFYEWAPGLDGGGGTLSTERFDAPLNLFHLLALDATARMARECGENDDAFSAKTDELRAAFADTFWDKNERAFRTFSGGGREPHYAELTQALAILAGAVPEPELAPLRERLATDNNGLVPCTISHAFYRFEALLTDRERYAPRVFELIARDWGYMLAQGATSFWETIDGASAFANAGSLCHGWSGTPAWFYGAYILGVKPTSPGFAKYSMEPVRGVVDKAEGRVPTPDGVIQARWHLENDKVVKELLMN